MTADNWRIACTPRAHKTPRTQPSPLIHYRLTGPVLPLCFSVGVLFCSTFPACSGPTFSFLLASLTLHSHSKPQHDTVFCHFFCRGASKFRLEGGCWCVDSAPPPCTKVDLCEQRRFTWTLMSKLVQPLISSRVPRCALLNKNPYTCSHVRLSVRTSPPVYLPGCRLPFPC